MSFPDLIVFIDRKVKNYAVPFKNPLCNAESRYGRTLNRFSARYFLFSCLRSLPPSECDGRNNR